MAMKTREMQRFIRYYKDETGKDAIDMKDVAKFAAAKNWPLPKPIDPIDLLAREFRRAARQEIRHDTKTGRPYRANHAITTGHGPQQMTLWIDIDEAPRRPMHNSLIQRREQMVGDGLQLTLDADHWNSLHFDEEPIVMPLDFTDDVEWRKAGPEDKAG